MVKGIIFDFDGVITDSEPFYINSMVEYLKRFNIESTFDECSKLIGKTTPLIMTDLKNKFNLENSVEEIINGINEIYETNVKIDSFVLMPGLMEFLLQAKSKGIRMAIASSSSMEYLYTNLDHFKIRDLFEFVVSGTEVKYGKPDPYIYNLVAQKLNINKDELIIIEDSPNGIAAGVASGIKTYALKQTICKYDTSAADIEVNSFAEIKI